MTSFAWDGSEELETLRGMYQAGATMAEIASALGMRLTQVEWRLKSERANGLTRDAPVTTSTGNRSDRQNAVVSQSAGKEQRELTVTDSGANATLRAIVRERVQTLDDLIRVCNIDATVWDIPTWKANAWESAAKNKEGKMVPCTMYQVHATMTRRKPVDNPTLILSAIETGLARVIKAKAAPRVWVKRSMRVLKQRIITDLHMGGHAWHRSTGGESWNLEKAVETARSANRYLDAHENPDATESCLAFLGDLGHYETKAGATSNGTLLDMDSRADLMIQGVVEYVLDTIRAEAERRPTTVYVLEGNHSGMLDKTLRQMARYYFAKHKGVTIVDQYTARQFFRWHNTLLGYTHGEKAHRKLAELMPIEAANLWTGAQLKEYHTGHLHHEAAKQKLHQVRDSLYEPTVTHAGVVVRIHMAMTPPDQYHADEGWLGAPQGMSDWYYHEAGAMIGSTIASPRVLTYGRVDRAAA